MTQLTCVLINDYSLTHSNTGPEIQHLLRKRIGEPPLELVATRMLNTDRNLMRALKDSFKGEKRRGVNKRMYDRFDRYIDREYIASRTPKRGMLLVFRGPDAVDQIRMRAGSPRTKRGVTGSTLREKYGHFEQDSIGRIIAFEPAVFIPFDEPTAERGLRIFADYSQQQPGILEGAVNVEKELREIGKDQLEYYLHTLSIHASDNLGREVTVEDLIPENIHRTIFMVKPPVMGKKPHLAGEFLDYLAAEGRKIVGAHYFYMGVGQFNQFYRHLTEKLTPEEYAKMCRDFTGYNPDADPSARTSDALHACFAFVYEGPFIVDVVRGIIGPTDPKKWRPGQIRHDYADDISRNAVHGTDSPIRFDTEARILGFDQPVLVDLVSKHYG